MTTPASIKKAAKKAYEDLLAGENRSQLLAALKSKFGPVGVFAFGQYEYSMCKRKNRLC